MNFKLDDANKLNVSKEERIMLWRSWREHLKTLSTEEVYKEVVVWWQYLPLVNRSVDIWDEASWPNPWELIQLGGWCENGQALGMFYTLCLIDLPCELQLVQDLRHALGGTYLVVESNGNMLLPNGELLKVTDPEFKVLKKWTASDLSKLVKL
jgi:hypothetical protein